MAGRDWKLTGGKAVNFDASMRIRIVLAGKVYDGSGDDASIVGERHLAEIHKTKVAGKVEHVEKSYFHTTLDGFDRARDVLRLAEDLGVVDKAGAWYSFGDRRLAQGEAQFARKATPELLDELEDACRAKFFVEGGA